MLRRSTSASTTEFFDDLARSVPTGQEEKSAEADNIAMAGVQLHKEDETSAETDNMAAGFMAMAGMRLHEEEELAT